MSMMADYTSDDPNIDVGISLNIHVQLIYSRKATSMALYTTLL